jgi:hypothetical protein
VISLNHEERRCCVYSKTLRAVSNNRTPCENHIPSCPVKNERQGLKFLAIQSPFLVKVRAMRREVEESSVPE